MISRIEPAVTVDDLDLMPEDDNRYEVIDGELFVSKAPGITHQVVFGNLFLSLSLYFGDNPIGKVIAGPGLILSKIDGVIPDLVVILNDRLAEVITGERLTAAPDLVVEVLSPGAANEQRDRVAKRQLYAKFGVKEYWIADLQTHTIHVHVLDGNALALRATYGEHDELQSSVLPNYRLEVGRVFSL